RGNRPGAGRVEQAGAQASRVKQLLRTWRVLRRQPPSAAREGQPERGHLLAVANQQDVASEHRVVPGLAFDRRESRELPELVWGRPDERQLTLLREHQQQVLIRQQHELTVAVPSVLPLALAVFQVDARE